MEGIVKYSLDANAAVADALGSAHSSSDAAQSVSKSARRVKQIWAVGGGKGGVGKSLVASSLAIALSRLGNRVIAIDLDLGGRGERRYY